MLGALLEVDLDKICTTPARESDLKVKIVKNWRSRDVFWGSKCVSRGRRKDFDTLQNTWQAQEFVRVAKTLAGVVDLKRLRNNAFRVAGAMISRFVMSMFDALDAETVEGLQISCHGNVTLQWSFRVAVTGLRMSRLNFFVAGAILLKRSIKNRYNVLEFWGQVSGQVVIFDGSLFVFELQSFIFEGSLAEMLRFWSSKLQFWRKSRTKASFLIFKAELLCSWASKFQFWRKSRTKASFLIFKASILKEVSYRKALFLSFKVSILKEVSQKSFESQTDWQQNHLNLRSIDNQLIVISNQLTNKIIWISNQLTTKIIWISNQLTTKIIWISNRLTTNSLKSQTDWQPNRLNLKSIDNQLIWISNRLTTKSLESQINWQPNHLNLKSIDSHITWSSNQQTTKIIWSTHRLTTKSFDSQLVWIWHQLTFEPIELRTLPSYRFLIFGNFRHRLVR